MIADIFIWILVGVFNYIFLVFPVAGPSPSAVVLAVNWIIQQAYKFNWIFPIDTILLVLVQVFLINFLAMGFRIGIWVARSLFSAGRNM